MISIKDREELKLWYQLLADLESLSPEKRPEDFIIGIKKDIRSYINKEEKKIIRQDFDGYIVMVDLPGKTKKEAEKYFLNNMFIHLVPSAYDCTGRAFTAWYKIAERHGSFVAYHSIAYDV